MGFVWEPTSVSGSGMPDTWDCPPSSAPSFLRHRERPGRTGPRPPARAHPVTGAIAAASRLAKTLIAARPPLTDHRRAF